MMVLVFNLFVVLNFFFFCFVVAKFDLVHNVEDLWPMLAANSIWNLFCNMSDAHETSNLANREGKI